MGNDRRARSLSAAAAAAKAVVFDFDGTLVDSNEIKWRGFEHAFSEYPHRISEISTYCRGSNHTIRGEKFRHVCEQILHQTYSLERERELHERYAAYTTGAVAEAKEIPGAAAFVRQVGKTRPVALLSSTPHAILLDILGRKGWLPLFQEIQGAPVVKRDWLAGYQLKLQCLPGDILFFGDTAEDEASARAFGCEFVRVGVTIPDFSGLLI